MKADDSELWKRAIEEEMDSFHRNITWQIVTWPSNQKIKEVSGIYVKHKADGRIDCYKARLVAKGFSQQPGTDYDDTHALVI